MTQHDKTYLKKVLADAGRRLLGYFGSTAIVSGKSHRDILTQADLESDAFITEALKQRFPDIPVLSEETVRSPEIEHAGRRFVLDPLDGTINFSRGIPEFGIFLAYQERGVTTYGLAYKPVTGEVCEGAKGEGSAVDGRPLHVSSVTRLAEAVVAVDTARAHATVPSYLNALHKQIRGFRSYGCAMQVLGYIARGQVDAYLFDTPHIWDIAAMQCIIEEAGGLVLDQKGNPWKDEAPILVCVPGIKEAILSVIRH